jgi:spermidine synthase
LPLIVLGLLFFLSGASALIFQVAWLRLLALVVGVTVHAASAVLSSFMGGLALGAWLGGRLADRVRHPLRAFALVELGIAASALAVPVALDAAGASYAALQSRAPDAGAFLVFVRVICSAAVLLVPTTLMGASLPLLARHVQMSAPQSATLVSRIGALYAANTAGGIAGTLLAGFVLIGAIGVTATTRLAAATNMLVAGLALGIWFVTARHRPEGSSATVSTPQPSAPNAPSHARRAVLTIFALSGFAGLGLEVVWFRLLVLFLPATTYAFTTMLGTVLLGIALGSAIAAVRVRRSHDPTTALVWIQVAAGVAAVLSMAALAYTYRIGWRTSGLTQACVVAMLPATTLMGATFPFGFAVWLSSVKEGLASRVGILYAVNVLGAVAGALAGGFLLLPLLGSRGSLLFLSAVYVASGCLLAVSAHERARALRISAAATVLFVTAASLLPDLYGAVLARRYGGDEQLVFRREGVQTTVTVHEQASGQRVMYLDGLHQANDSAPMVRLHAEIGHLAMVLHPAPRRALVIGLGGGVTAGAVASHANTRVDVVELASGVVDAAPYFASVNGGVLQNPNVRVRIDDGRNYLWLTPDRYDVLTADTIQPIHAGSGNLYSVEYFRLSRRVLRQKGLAVQWIGHREEKHYKLIMRTFLEAYPHATLWADGGVMIGSLTPLRLSRETYERRFASDSARAALARVGLDSFDAVLARYTAGPDEMRRFVGDGPILTDDRPLLEYHRSIRDSGPPVDLSSLRGDINRHLRP